MTGKDMNGDQKGHKSTKIPISSQLVTGNYSQGGKFTAEDISLFHILSSVVLYKVECVGDVNLCVLLCMSCVSLQVRA